MLSETHTAKSGCATKKYFDTPRKKSKYYWFMLSFEVQSSD